MSIFGKNEHLRGWSGIFERRASDRLNLRQHHHRPGPEPGFLFLAAAQVEPLARFVVGAWDGLKVRKPCTSGYMVAT